MKYRIIQEGNRYYVEHKGWLWGWNREFKEYYSPAGSVCVGIVFRSAEEAEDYIRNLPKEQAPKPTVIKEIEI